MISPNFEAMYNYRFLHVLLLMFLLRCPIQHISEMLQSKNNKKTHHQPWIQVNKMVPPFLFANISKSLGFLSHGISSSQRSLFGVELPRWHVCLRSKHQHGWKARSLFFCWWFFYGFQAPFGSVYLFCFTVFSVCSLNSRKNPMFLSATILE